MLRIAIVLALVGCHHSDDSGRHSTDAPDVPVSPDDPLIGMWQGSDSNNGTVMVRYDFRSDGTYAVTSQNGADSGTWTDSKGYVLINAKGDTIAFDAEVIGDMMVVGIFDRDHAEQDVSGVWRGYTRTCNYEGMMTAYATLELTLAPDGTSHQLLMFTCPCTCAGVDVHGTWTRHPAGIVDSMLGDLVWAGGTKLGRGFHRVTQ